MVVVFCVRMNECVVSLGFEFVPVNVSGVDVEFVGHVDDGASHNIFIPFGFPFGNSIQTNVYVRQSIAVVLFRSLCSVT